MMRFTLLDPLRGFAALWVFAFHLGFSSEFQAAWPGVHAVLRHGELGVPMFFVISGFCITAAARRVIEQGRSTTQFLRRRLWRIYPTFWCSILVTAATPFAIELLSSLKTGRYTPPSATHLNYGYLNYSLWDWAALASLGQVFRSVPEAQSLQFKFTSINAVYWTLAIEVQFYAVVAACVLFRRRFYGAMGIVTVVSLTGLWYGIPPAISGWFLPFWPMFAVGVLVYGAFEQGWLPSSLKNRRLIGSCRLLSVTLAATALVSLAWGLSPDPLGFAAGFGAFLLLLEGWDEPFRSLLARAEAAGKVWFWFASLPTTLGLMSYSLYLPHGRL